MDHENEQRNNGYTAAEHLRGQQVEKQICARGEQRLDGRNGQAVERARLKEILEIIGSERWTIIGPVFPLLVIGMRAPPRVRTRLMDILLTVMAQDKF